MSENIDREIAKSLEAGLQLKASLIRTTHETRLRPPREEWKALVPPVPVAERGEVEREIELIAYRDFDKLVEASIDCDGAGVTLTSLGFRG